MYKSFNNVDEKKPSATGQPNVIDVKPADSSNEKPLLEQSQSFEAVPTWSEFTQNTTFHGVRYIFEPGSYRHRRILWTLIVVGAIVGFLTEVGTRVHVYYQYNTNVDVEVIYTEDLLFPTVTICNQNTFRITEVVQWSDGDLYKFIDTVFGVKDPSTVDVSNFDVNGINSTEFILSAAHRKEDLIDSCYWHSMPCNVQEDFTPILTDLGLCYQFNSAKRDHLLKVKEAGSKSGLSLVLNVEQYEYMRGPQNDAGIKILLYDQKGIPQMDEQGFAAAPGSHTLVGIKTKQVLTLEHPYGMCKEGQEPVSNCQSECKAKQMANLCNCSVPHFQVDGVPFCDLVDSFVCLRVAQAEIAQNTTGCKCPVQCNRTVYEPILSFAQLSKFNLDRIALSDDVRRKMVKTKFMSAMETSQRVVETIVTKDEYIMNNILTLITKVQENVNSTKEAFRSGETFSKYFRVVDLFSTDDTTWKKEKEQIQQMTYALTYNVYSFNMEGSKLYDFYTRLRGVLKINKNNESKVVSDLQRCAENRPRHPIYGTTFNPHTDFPTGLYVGAIRSVGTSPPSIVKKSQITEDQNSLDDKETQLSSPIRDESEAFGSIRYARSTKDDIANVTSGIKGEIGSSSPPVKRLVPDSISGEPDHFFSSGSYLYNSPIGSVSNAMKSTNSYVEVFPSVSSPSSSIFMRQMGIFPGDDPFGSGDDPFGSGDDPFGSGDEHPFPPHFCDYWNYVDTDDYMSFTDKYDVYRGGESLVQQIMPGAEGWKSGYNNMIKAIFDGSYIDVNSFPEHGECIKALDVFNVDFNNTLRSLGNNAERFFSCYDYDRCSTAGPNLLNSIVSLDVEKSKASLDKCNWVYETWSRETASGRYSDVESALATVNQHSNNIKQSFKNFVKGIEALPAQLQTSLSPLEEMLKLYLNKNLTKAALASILTSRTVDNAITEILDLQNNIKNVLNELVNSVDSMWTTVANLYETILDRDITLVKPSGILELEFPGLVTELNRTKRHLFLNTLDMNDAQYVDVVIETLDVIFKNYSSIFYDIHEKQVHVVMDLVAQIDDLSDDLYNYLTALKMDKDFIMENFLQIDVFYKELSYEKIEQQKAFEFSSLLSEVGGFLGLLLGASIITMFEILDYLIISFAYDKEQQAGPA